ncbi:MAG: metallophosphoesterase [Clostridiales bacterium]|nr:metallophosphoesterase [Clostridiales bacterium]
MKKRRKRASLYIFLGLILIAATLWAHSNLVIQKTGFSVVSPKISAESIKIVFISDLHDRQFGKYNSYLVSIINKENPDLVLFGGDMVNSDTENTSKFFEFAKTIAQKFETYMVMGNHEEMMPKHIFEKLKNSLSENGVKILDNETVSLDINETTINLFGVMLPLYTYSGVEDSGEPKYSMTAEQLTSLFGEIDSNAYNILLAHNPLFFSEYAKWGADLILSGHIHGGIVRVPFVGGIFSPNGEIFPEYDAGEYILDSSKMIVTRGLAEYIAPLRLFNPAEVCVVELGDSN